MVSENAKPHSSTLNLNNVLMCYHMYIKVCMYIFEYTLHIGFCCIFLKFIVLTCPSLWGKRDHGYHKIWYAYGKVIGASER